MIDGNISMEEDTELRDLVVQTLENNGVLAKVRAELRASVFLTLEEQESVLNPEPCLNRSVKQYLTRPEGKLLFSLVREFLEYFGLDYTMSVYDPETYLGKEYNYVGRNKLCQDLSMQTKEPLLGEILKNTINSVLNSSSPIDNGNSKTGETSELSENQVNATFNLSVPKVLQRESSNVSVGELGKFENISGSNSQILSDIANIDGNEKTTSKTHSVEDTVPQKYEDSSKLLSNISHIKLITTKPDIHYNKELSRNNKNFDELQTVNNVKNKEKVEAVINTKKTVYFDEIVVDGNCEKVVGSKDNKILLGESPSTNNYPLDDLPPLNDRKANIIDLKELIDIAQGVSQFDDVSSTSISVEEQNFQDKDLPLDSDDKDEEKQNYTGKHITNTHSKTESEEIKAEIYHSNS